MVEPHLFRLLYLSIAAALATIALKTAAFLLTGSVALFSDAAESLVNLVAALAALGLLYLASRPADDDHAHGHAKAEYFSAGLEGGMILIAALVIAVSAIERLLSPSQLSDVAVGLVVAGVSALINLAVGLALVRSGRRHHSIVIEADGRHLLTDVFTSVGVIVGVALVALTGIAVLDPIVALLVAGNIVVTGIGLVRRSVDGLMDRSLSPEEFEEIEAVLERHREGGVQFHALRTRRSGSRSFVSLHVLVPGAWSVQLGHDFAEELEEQLRRCLYGATIITHLEPLEDPASFLDENLDRQDLHG